jgi:hypothetical protein
VLFVYLVHVRSLFLLEFSEAGLGLLSSGVQGILELSLHF